MDQKWWRKNFEELKVEVKIYGVKTVKNVMNTLFLTFFLTHTLPLDETYVGLTILCGIQFQSVIPT